MLTYSIQKAGYDFQQLDAQGGTDFRSFMAAFDAFPWGAQYAEWNETQEGPIPALVLQETDDRRELWVSALSDDLTRSFQLNSVTTRARKGLFGKEKLEQDVATIDVKKRDDVETLCQLFCDRQYAELDRLVDEFVARNLEDDDIR
jgi:hypothetical protein